MSQGWNISETLRRNGPDLPACFRFEIWSTLRSTLQTLFAATTLKPCAALCTRMMRDTWRQGTPETILMILHYKTIHLTFIHTTENVFNCTKYPYRDPDEPSRGMEVLVGFWKDIPNCLPWSTCQFNRLVLPNRSTESYAPTASSLTRSSHNTSQNRYRLLSHSRN